MAELYQITSADKVPDSSPAGIFTYAPITYDKAAVTRIRLDVTTPELADAAFVTSREEEP